MMDLQENLQQVEANICKACENAGRKRSDVTLIAVSKTKPIEMLQTCLLYTSPSPRDTR